VDKTWEIDDANTVKARFGGFGKKIVTVNGKEVHNSRQTVSPKKPIVFSLPDGRGAEISARPNFMGAPNVDLRVGGNLMVETGKAPIKCGACGTIAKPYDRFCGKCGKPMPTAEDYELQKNVKSATSAIKVLAVLFVIAGLLFFMVSKGSSDQALAKLEGMDEAAVYPTTIDGQTYTVGALRKQLAWEPWGVLLVNLIIAAIMLVLALWAKSKPLPAVLIATATYIVVLVADGIADPSSLAKGWLIKLIIIAFLIKGIKAALALRAARA
jgi:hypothetical protein